MSSYSRAIASQALSALDILDYEERHLQALDEVNRVIRSVRASCECAISDRKKDEVRWKEFCKGNKLLKVQYSMNLCESLTLGTTSSNDSLVCDINKILEDLQSLIDIETLAINVIKEYTAKIDDIAGYFIEKLKRDTGYLDTWRERKRALGVYLVDDTTFEAELKSSIESFSQSVEDDEEDFDIFFINCGLKSLVAVVKEVTSLNMYECLKALSNEFEAQDKSKSHISSKVLKKGKVSFVKNLFETLAIERGINIKDAIDKIVEDSTYVPGLNKYDDTQKKQILDKFAKDWKSKVQNSLKKLETLIQSNYRYNHIARELCKLGGVGYCIIAYNGGSGYFYKKDKSFVKSTQNIKWYTSSTCDEINRDIKEIKEERPAIIYKVVSVAIPQIREKFESPGRGNIIEYNDSNYEALLKVTDEPLCGVYVYRNNFAIIRGVGNDVNKAITTALSYFAKNNRICTGILVRGAFTSVMEGKQFKQDFVIGVNEFKNYYDSDVFPKFDFNPIKTKIVELQDDIYSTVGNIFKIVVAEEVVPFTVYNNCNSVTLKKIGNSNGCIAYIYPDGMIVITGPGTMTEMDLAALIVNNINSCRAVQGVYFSPNVKYILSSPNVQLWDLFYDVYEGGRKKVYSVCKWYPKLSRFFDYEMDGSKMSIQKQEELKQKYFVPLKNKYCSYVEEVKDNFTIFKLICINCDE